MVISRWWAVGLPLLVRFATFISIMKADGAPGLLATADENPMIVGTIIEHDTNDHCFADRQEYIDKLLTRGRWVQLPPSVPHKLTYRTQPSLDVREGFSTGKCANASYLAGNRYIWQPRDNTPSFTADVATTIQGHAAEVKSKRAGKKWQQRTRTELCSIINGRNILVVGDSMSNGGLCAHPFID
jgi:hypothetical protein